MKKIYAILGAAVVCSTAVASPLDGRINLKDKVKVDAMKEKKVEVTSSSSVEVRPLQLPAPNREASVERSGQILYENFDAVPDGRTEQTGTLGERYIDFIASHYYEPGRYIDNEYTPESGTWEGDWVFAGKGGTVVMQCYNPQAPASLNTPLGDFSGDLTVTMRVRYSKIFWGADNEVGYVTSGGSDISVAAYINGYDSYDQAKTDAGYGLSSGQIYENEGWQELTFKFRNESAHASGYLRFWTSGAIEIDWIKVMDDNTFLACPAMNPVTDFKNDSFTINWDPMRRSYNYYIDLWKTVYTADSGIDATYDFEGDELPAWLTGDDYEIVDGEGYEGSKAFMFTFDGQDAALSTVDEGKKLTSLTTRVKFRMDDENSALTLMYDVYGDNGWEPFGYLQCDGFWTGPGYYYNVILDGEEFEDKYTAVRVYPEGVTEDNGIYLDNMSLLAKRPFVLERVESDFGHVYDPENDDYAYNYYTYTGIGSKYDPQDLGRTATHYTFVGLDPNTEYWYRVRSHHVSEFSVGEKYHAFGVAAPELLPATNVTTGSYTANWKDAPKAQKYIVTNYMSTKVDADDPEYSYMLESFSGCEGEFMLGAMQPIDNAAECYLDEYTDLKGWRGKNNYVGQNMIGGADYSGSYLISPVMMINPDRGTVLVYIEAQGYNGDTFSVKCMKGGAYGYFSFDENGSLSGWFEIPAIEGEQLRFTSYNGLAFAVSAFEVVQAVEAGDVVRKFDSVVEVPAGEGAYTFNNLDNDLYAYGVVSSFTLEHETVLSNSSNAMVVNLVTGESTPTTKLEMIGGEEAEEVARYSVDGLQVDKNYKGVVIVKMNDGSVIKQLAR